VLLLAFSRGNNAPGDLISNAALSAVYLQNLVNGDLPKVNIAYWSLEIEVQFYLLAPLLAKVFRIGNGRLRLVVLLVAIFASALMQQIVSPYPRLSLSILGSLHYFLAGFLLAEIYVSRWRERPPTPSFVIAALTLFGALLIPVVLHHEFTAIRGYVLPILICFFYAGVLRGVWFTRWLSWPFVTVIGGMCYSIYLLHFPIIYAAGRFVQKVGPVGDRYDLTFIVHALPILICVLAASGLFYMLVERPCMDRNWPAKLLSAIRVSKKRKSDPVEATA
jgi:peptidoglycan/LPS O-acetylase OafA/YrhL